MGMRHDMAQCMSLTWVDNREWHSCIKAAREIIYVKGYKMDSKVVEDLLQCDSLVLTVVSIYFSLWACWCWHPVTSERVFRQANAARLQHVQYLCCRLNARGWAGCLVFIHLLRLLDCHDESSKHELDQWQVLIWSLVTWHWLCIRFREILPFGTNGIRRITMNWSELKKMTVCDYDNMLQVGYRVIGILNLTNVLN